MIHVFLLIFLFKREPGVGRGNAWGEGPKENIDAGIMSKGELVWGLFLHHPSHSILHRMRIFCSASRLGLSCEKCTLISSFLITFFWG